MDKIQIADDLIVGFQTSDPVIKEIYEELDGHSLSTQSSTDLVFRGHKTDFSTKTSSVRYSTTEETLNLCRIPDLDRWSVKDAVRRRIGLLGWNIEISQPKGTVVLEYDQRINTKPTITEAGLRFLNRSYIWRYQNLAKILLYNVVEPIIHGALLAKRSAFLHSSAVAYEDRGILITGSGGAGKTSTMETLMSWSECEFVADDLCLVTGEGYVYPYLKRVQIYPYNLTEEGKEIVTEEDPVGTRLQWEARGILKGKDGVRRRVSPKQRYENIREGRTVIDEVFFLQRAPVKSINIQQLDLEEFAHRSVAVIAEEFDQLLEQGIKATAVGASTNFGPISFPQRTFEIYEEAFKDTNIQLIEVPYDAGPDDLQQPIQNQLI